MIRHIAELSNEFKTFFVDVSDKQEQNLKIAMEYWCIDVQINGSINILQIKNKY